MVDKQLTLDQSPEALQARLDAQARAIHAMYVELQHIELLAHELQAAAHYDLVDKGGLSETRDEEISRIVNRLRSMEHVTFDAIRAVDN